MPSSQQLSPSEFLDRIILLLAARHGASVTGEEEQDEELEQQQTEEEYEQQQTQAWHEVSRDMQALAKAPSCRSGDLRIVSNMVHDAEAFSPQACINRAQFAIYRLEKEHQQQKAVAKANKMEKKKNKKQSSESSSSMKKMTADQYVDPSDPKPSGFDITKGHSIADAVNRIMEDCRARIMNIGAGASGALAGVDSSSDDDDENNNTSLEIFKPPEHIARSLMMTEEESKKAMELGHAEEELINRVHRLQTEHFKKYKRWINLGTGECMNPEQDSSSMMMISSSSSQQENNTNVNKKIVLAKLSADDVAEMLGKLNLGEHVSSFRRTTGHLLNSMSKDDIRLRFDKDNEATDILWAHLEENYSRETPGKINFNNNTHSSSPSSSTRPSLMNNNNNRNSNNINNTTTTRTYGSNNSKESSQMKAIYDAIAAPSREFMVAQHEADQDGVSVDGDPSLKNQLLQGNFHALKRTLDILEGRDDEDDEDSKSANNRNAKNINSSSSNGRPLRPSQEYRLMQQQQGGSGDLNNEEDEEENLQALTSGYMNRLANNNNNNNTTSSSVAASKARQENSYGRGGGSGVRGGRGGGSGVVVGGRGGGGASTTSAPTSSSSSAPPPAGKGGRWSIVEYDSDEDDVE